MAAFITVWKTDNPGSTNDNQIRLGLRDGGTYDFTVDWGDGTSDTITEWDQAEVTHTYGSIGTYTVTITGTIIYWAGWDVNKLLEIQQWGDLKFTNLSSFNNCQFMDVTATDTPDLSGITSLQNFFSRCNKLVNANGSISDWNVTGITNMQGLFFACHLFNQPLNDWDVSNVTNMFSMFNEAHAFNQPLNNWDVGNLADFQWMFSHCYEFNQPLNNWDVSGANTLSSMFNEAHAFNQPLDKWDLRNVTNISQMFRFQGFWGGQMSFDQDLSNWDVSGITNFNTFMFGCKLSTTNYDLLLNSWAYQSLQTTIHDNRMDFGNSKYGDSEYCDGATARQYIIDTYGFNIIDGGGDPDCVAPPLPPLPHPFCDSTNYQVTNATCGNDDGTITINYPYEDFYDFQLIDQDGNTFNVGDGLYSGYYTIKATPKEDYQSTYGRRPCYIRWIEIHNTDTTISLERVSIKPAICQGFGRQTGRLAWLFTDTNPQTYTFKAYDVNSNLIDEQTGLTEEEIYPVVLAPKPSLYYILLINEVTGCKYLDSALLGTESLYNVQGISKLYLQVWHEGITIDYWSAEDDDFYVGGYDAQFFFSTKIKRFNNIDTPWYRIKLDTARVDFNQNLIRDEKGISYSQTLNLVVPKQENIKWLDVTERLLPHRFIIVFCDNNDRWWTMGYRSGMEIKEYGIQENDYQISFIADNVSKLLTSIDEDYVKDEII